jgi:seryl-tRNA synthetase
MPGTRPGHDALDKTMHDIRFIREHPEAFDRGLLRRGLEPQAQRLISIYERRLAIVRVLEKVQAQRNAVSKAIGQAKAEKDDTAAAKLMLDVAELKTSIAQMEAEDRAVETELDEALAEIPNLPLDDVPDGRDANDNVERHHFGAKRNYAFTPKQHFDLGEALGQMDFEAAAKLSGARFVVLKKGLARLERALGQFMLDVQTSAPHNYTEVAPPLLVRDEVMYGTGQLPKFEDDQFPAIDTQRLNKGLSQAISAAAKDAASLEAFRRAFNQAIDEFDRGEITDEDINVRRRELEKSFAPVSKRAAHFADRLWLIPTAEVPLTNLVRESILDEAQLPMRMTAGTPCFRAEAGAAGKDTRGMIRLHQFNKVELVSITTPDQSPDEHERMLACAEEVLKRLELHYRVVTLCAGDMGFASQKTYDIEVWLPGQGAYREISSCSNCGEFQARRMNARYRPKEGRQVRHVHTLNGSGVAVGRALIAVMETYQQENGAIAVPEALAPYMGGIKTIEKQ